MPNDYCPIHNPILGGGIPCICPPRKVTASHKCLVCEGSGRKYIQKPEDLSPSDPRHNFGYKGTFVFCHGCDGKGWVTV